MLSQAGFITNNGGAEEAVRLLSEFGWAELSWTTCASQIAKWLPFCDEDISLPLPATEGEVMAYSSFLALEGQVAPQSLRQYISAVSRYHELHQLSSPTRTDLIYAKQKAYRRAREDYAFPVDIIVGCPASVMWQFVIAGHSASSFSDMECFALTVLCFVFQVRSVSAAHLRCDHLTFDSKEFWPPSTDGKGNLSVASHPPLRHSTLMA